jgi:hypothetical protein
LDLLLGSLESLALGIRLALSRSRPALGSRLDLALGGRRVALGSLDLLLRGLKSLALGEGLALGSLDLLLRSLEDLALGERLTLGRSTALGLKLRGLHLLLLRSLEDLLRCLLDLLRSLNLLLGRLKDLALCGGAALGGGLHLLCRDSGDESGSEGGSAEHGVTVDEDNTTW